MGWKCNTLLRVACDKCRMQGQTFSGRTVADVKKLAETEGWSLLTTDYGNYATCCDCHDEDTDGN